MIKKILDTSIVVKWFLEEADSDKALTYLKDFIDGHFVLVIPSLLFYELGNVFWKKKIPVEDISAIMQRFQSFSEDQLIKDDTGFISFRKTYQIAREYNTTFYDASYVTLLQKYDCEFVTADRPLFNRLKKIFSKITLLS